MPLRLLPPRPAPVPRTLLATGLALVALHLLLIAKVTGSLDQGLLSLLFWLAIIAQVKDHLPPRLPRSRSATGLGALLVCLLMLKTWHLYETETSLVRLFPLFAFGGWSLMVRGWRLLPWWQAWVLVVTLSVPIRALPMLVEGTLGDYLQTATAAIAAFMLHYVGYEVVQQGPLIQLPTGTVEVELACTGVGLLGLLLQVSVLIAAATQWRYLKQLVARSVCIAALLSIIRVALMAAVVSYPALFQFWHGANGGQVFTLLALGILVSLGLPAPPAKAPTPTLPHPS
jgi:cyanoexosortase A